MGLIEGLLLVRLVALLFAARPDHPALALLLALTAPLAAPWQVINRLTSQPQWGARLDLATLAAMVILLGIAAALHWLVATRAEQRPTGAYHAQSQ